MHFNHDTSFDHPLRHLTDAQFMALGGNAVVYVRQVVGAELAEMLPEGEMTEPDQSYHLVVAADGSPLMVGDTAESVSEWLAGQPFGVVTVH